jgi:2-methylisocitrate lyase-like PEP mutase family enzyme
MEAVFAQARTRFRALHREGIFILPNPWDIGSARLMQHLGFQALASTSTGYAWAAGRPDYAVSRDDVLGHLAALARGTNLPLNADFEAGFAPDPEGVAENVGLAIKAGVAGLSIEDRDVEKGTLYDTRTSVERLKAARHAIDQSGEDVILVARTEGLLFEPGALKPAIEKLVAFAEAGADCLYAPGVRERGEISQLVRAVAPKPLNVVMMRPGLTLTELADLGVRRVSVGGALARVMWAAVVAAARELKEGRFDALASGTPGSTLNEIFVSADANDAQWVR